MSPKEAKTGELLPYGYGADQGAGFETVSDKDLVLPMLSVLQPLSKQVSGATKVPGAEPGKLFDTVTEEAFDEAGFVPACIEHCFVEWVPRDAGGGLVARHRPDSEAVLKAKAESTKFGKYKVGTNDLVEPYYVYGLLFRDGRAAPAVIPFTSTKIGVYKKWITNLRLFVISTADGKVTPPLFAHSVKVKTVAQSNKKGNFFNLSLAPLKGGVQDSLIDSKDERYRAAKQLKEMVASGHAKIAEDSQDSPAEPETEVF